MITTLLLVSTLGASPTWSVAVTRRIGVDADTGLVLAGQFAEALSRHEQGAWGENVSPRALSVTLAAANTPDAAVCSGAPDCAVSLGRIGKLQRIVALQIVKAGSEVVLDADLKDVSSGASQASVTGTVPLKKAEAALDALAGELWRGAAKAGEKLSAGSERGQPSSGKGLGEVAGTSRRVMLRRNAWIPGVAGAGALAMGAIVFGMGTSQAGALSRGEPAFSTHDELRRAIESSVDTQRTGVIVAGVGLAAIAGAGAMYLLGGSGAGPVVSFAPTHGGASVVMSARFP